MSVGRKRWLGGYVRVAKRGPVFIIERWARGARFHVSTGCSTERAALKELERFEADPAGYVPNGGTDALRLTAEMALEYRVHQLAQGVTPEWANEVGRCLADWIDILGRHDLRRLSLHRDLKPALDRWRTRRGGRIKALKGLFRWLRQERGLVTHSQDATVDLRVPQSRPEKWRRRKIVPPEDVAAVLRHLPPETADVLHLLSATSWHLSEVRRFAEGGEIAQPVGAPTVLAVLIVRQKSGELTKTPVGYVEHLEAARRIRSSGQVASRVTLARHMRIACRAAGVPWFGLGQMRHTVLTWAVEDGASLKDAAEFAHHRSEATTRRWYVDLNVPRAPLPVRRLLGGQVARLLAEPET